MGGETIRDVVFRLRIELAEQQMKAPDVRPVVEAQEKIKKATVDTAKAAEDSARAREREIERIGAILRKDYERGKALRDNAARDAERAAAAQIRAEERVARAAERAAAAKERAYHKASMASLRAADGVLQLGRGLALMGVMGEKSTEALLRKLIGVSAAIDVARGSMQAMNAIRQAGGMGAVAGTMAGKAGIIGAGVGLGLGVISLFHEGTREGLSELLGFSDMAGEQREAGARMVTRGQAFNQGIAARREAAARAVDMRISAATFNKNPLEAARTASNMAREQIGRGETAEAEFRNMERLVGYERQRLQLVIERGRAEAETAGQAERAARAGIETSQGRSMDAAARFRQMSPGERQQVLRAQGRLSRGESLSDREAAALGGFSNLAGIGPQLGNENLRAARAMGFGALEGGERALQADLDFAANIRSAQERALQANQKQIEAAAEKSVNALTEGLVSAGDKMTEMMVAELNRRALVKANEGQVDQGDGSVTAFFRELGFLGPGHEIAKAKRRANGR